MTTTDPHTLVGAYALDALPFDEYNLFEDHLDRCSECRGDVEEFQATAARLARATAVAPPADLRDRVLADVARTRQMPPGTGASRGPRRRWPIPAAAAAAVLLVALLGVLVVRADRRADDAEKVAAVVTAPDAQTVQVKGDDTAMKVVVSDDQGASVVIADGLEPVPSGKAYALWFQEDGKMVLHSLFTPDDEGDVEQRIDAVPADLVGVTVEDEGGADEPTPPILATGTL